MHKGKGKGTRKGKGKGTRKGKGNNKPNQKIIEFIDTLEQESQTNPSAAKVKT